MSKVADFARLVEFHAPVGHQRLGCFAHRHFPLPIVSHTAIQSQGQGVNARQINGVGEFGIHDAGHHLPLLHGLILVAINLFKPCPHIDKVFREK